jgi:hypothetical protein
MRLPYKHKDKKAGRPSRIPPWFEIAEIQEIKDGVYPDQAGTWIK